MNLLDKYKLELAIKEIRLILPEFKETCKLVSEQMKMYYDALIDVGFTEEQAMDLLAFHGIDIGKISNWNSGSTGCDIDGQENDQ